MKTTHKIISGIAAITLLNSSAVANEVLSFGAQTEALTTEASTTAGLKSGQGFVVIGVREGSAAAKLGLVEGDVVTALNGKPVNNFVMLSNLIAAIGQDNEDISLTWTRDGVSTTKSVSVSEKISREAFTAEYDTSGEGNGEQAVQQITTKNLSYVIQMGPQGTTSSRIIDGYSFTTTQDKTTKKQITKVTKSETSELVYEGEIDADDLSALPAEIQEAAKQFADSASTFSITAERKDKLMKDALSQLKGIDLGNGQKLDLNLNIGKGGVIHLNGDNLSETKTEKNLEDLVEEVKEEAKEEK